MVESLVRELRTAGMVLWVENDRIRGRMREGGKIPYELRQKAEQLRDMGMVAVDFIRREGVLRLTDLPPDEAFALGETVKRGESLLVSNVIYHRATGLFDITFVPLEGSDQHERETTKAAVAS